MADSQGQNYYWQSDNQNTTGENVGSVLDDLCNIVVITEIQDNQNTVTFVPGLNGERGHFRLGVGSKPINVDKYTILTATGSPDNYAEGNEVGVFLKTGTTYGGESCAFFTSNEVNGFRFQGTDGENDGTDFIAANNAIVEIGNKPAEPWEEGVWDFTEYKGNEVNNTSFVMENGAQVFMKAKDKTEIPTISMEGNSFIDFQWNDQVSTYCDFLTSDESITNARTTIRRYADPFGVIKGYNFIDSGAPIFQMHDAATLQMSEKSLLQMRNGAAAIVQGNANIKISGGEWSDSYHGKFNGSHIFEITYNHDEKIEGRVIVDYRGVILTANILKNYLRYRDKFYNNMLKNYLDIVDPVNTDDRIPGVTVLYENLTRDQVKSSYMNITNQSFSEIAWTPTQAFSVQWENPSVGQTTGTVEIAYFISITDVTLMPYLYKTEYTIEELQTLITYIEQNYTSQEIRVAYYTITREKVFDTQYTSITNYIARDPSYGADVSDIGKITSININPNTVINLGSDNAATSSTEIAEFRMEPKLIRVAVGEGQSSSGTFPGMSNFVTHPGVVIGSFNAGLADYSPIEDSFFISKNFFSFSDYDREGFHNHIRNFKGVSFSLYGDAAFDIHTGSESAYCETKDIASQTAAYDTLNIGGSVNYFNQKAVSSNTDFYNRETYGGKYTQVAKYSGETCRDFTFEGETSIKYHSVPTDEKNPSFGIDMTSTNVDITGYAKTFQGVISVNDSFAQIGGNCHHESWSGTFIQRSSNPTLTRQPHDPNDNYPLLIPPTGTTTAVQRTITMGQNNPSDATIRANFTKVLANPGPKDNDFKTYGNAFISGSITKSTSKKVYYDTLTLYNVSTMPYVNNATVHFWDATEYTDVNTLFSSINNVQRILEAVGLSTTTVPTFRNGVTPTLENLGKDETNGNQYHYHYKLTGLSLNITSAQKLCRKYVGDSVPTNPGFTNTTSYNSMSEDCKAWVDEACNIAGRTIYNGGTGYKLAECESGSIQNKNNITTNYYSPYSASSSIRFYETEITAPITWNYTSKLHLDQDWLGPIQTADRVGAGGVTPEKEDWERGSIIQTYGPTNFTMREKWVADTDHTKTFDLTSSATYNVSNQAQAIADFQANATDYAAFEAYLTQEDYTLWDILSIATADGGYTITFSICEAGWKPHIDSYPDNPVVEITDGSELRLYGGVKVKGETKYGVTTFTFSGTQSEGEVSFTLDELRSLKALIGSVRTSVVNDASEATEPGIIYFVDEGGNA